MEKDSLLTSFSYKQCSEVTWGGTAIKQSFVRYDFTTEELLELEE